MPYQDKEGRVCGFLNIEETENSGSFCRRYFVLDQNNGKLVYYMDSPANLPEAWKSPVGEINIHNISKVSDGAKLRPKVKYCFTVTVAGRLYFLQAEEDPDKWQWIEAINNASKIKVPEQSIRQTTQEWHAADLSQEAYVTEIAGGVVCKMPVQSAEVDSDTGSEDESRSSSSGRYSPTSSLNLGPSTFAKDKSSSLDHNKASSIPSTKKGFCVKQGAVRKNWKRRYFVLHQQGLSYYKSDQDKNSIRTIPIEDILEARQAEVGAHPNRDNLFEVLTSKRIFYIQCDTPEDMKSWIDAVKASIRQRRLDERKSMQDPSSSRSTLDEEVSSGAYPSPIWARDRASRDSKQQKKSFILW